MILRPYQNQSIAEIRDLFKGGKKRVIMCLPTGAGKTVTFTEFARLTVNNNRRALVLTDRKELCSQAGGVFESAGLEPEYIIAGKRKFNEQARCFVGMAETVYRRLKSGKADFLKSVDLVIVDEAHKGNFRKLISEFFSNTFIIGATATPVSASPRNPEMNLNLVFDSIVEPVNIGGLIGSEFLCDSVTLSNKELAKKAGDMKAKRGEYTSESQAQHTVITVLKYNHYQSSDKLIDNPVTKQSQSSDKAVTTNKNVNNDN